jgi:hypothetical protein
MSQFGQDMVVNFAGKTCDEIGLKANCANVLLDRAVLSLGSPAIVMNIQLYVFMLLEQAG